MKVWTQVPAGDINGANQRLWSALGNNADDVAHRINTNPEFVASIARFMLSGGYEPSTSQNLARMIMGSNFFGIAEAMKYFGVIPTKRELAYLAEVPFSKETLESCKDTHILIAAFPLSILNLRGVVGNIRTPDMHSLFLPQDWYDEKLFAKDKGILGWQLVRKEPLAESLAKSWRVQQSLLPEDEEVPTARILVYTILGHFLNTGEHLFKEVFVHCSGIASPNNLIYVGCSSNHWVFSIGESDINSNSTVVGLASVKKK